MKFPSSYSDVDGAHPSDAEDSSVSEEDIYKESRRNNVAISSGRRAMLRVSARAYDKRKENNKSTPLQNVESRCHVALMSNENESEVKVAGPNPPCIVEGNGERIRRFEEARRAISGSLALHHMRPDTIGESEERIRRFEDAHKAMMRATLVNCGNDEMVVSTRWLKAGCKRWTRDPNITSAVSIDGRMYDDLQRTPTISSKQMNVMNDRSTRWWTSPRNIRQFCMIGEKNSLSRTLAHVIEAEKNPQEALYIDKMSDSQPVVNGTKQYHTHKNASVGISTLRLLFSGVQNTIERPLQRNISHLRSKEIWKTTRGLNDSKQVVTQESESGSIGRLTQSNVISYVAPIEEIATDVTQIEARQIDHKAKELSKMFVQGE